MVKISQRRLWLLGAIALGFIILITLLAAPNHKLNNGSTYSREPSGYGAWYTFMSERETPIKRWQKPLPSLVDKNIKETPITLLQIHSSLTEETNLDANWIKAGNTLVILGVYEPVSEASFSSLQENAIGKIKIDTRRRKQNSEVQLLGDDFGSVVWQTKIGDGQIIYAVTPYLAANAYQDFQANYEFLAKLVTKPGNPIWVDEYSHGYKDADVIKQEIGDNVWSYFTKTPILPLLVQAIVILLVAIWMGNHRFGKAVTLASPKINNSEAYIQALAGVLQKAESHEFVISAIAPEEQQQLQKALGLGDMLLDSQSLIDAWVQQTGQPANELISALNIAAQKHRQSDIALLTWLEKWQTIQAKSKKNSSG